MPRHRRLALIATAIFSLTVFPSTAAAFDPNGVDLELTPVATGLDRPILLTHAGDGSGRLFVVEQHARIRVITAGGAVLSTPMIDLTSVVSKGGEQGLLGLAFHPDHETNGKFYVNYTNQGGDTVIREYRVGADPNRVLAGSGRLILTIDQPYTNHNGGHMAFGPDGYLYVGTGDGGSGGDPENRAQNLSSLLGKILRIDIDGTTSTTAYRIPASNPRVGKIGRDELWSWGLRNPWRWSFDRNTGGLYIGDVGQGRFEEIDRSYAGSQPVGGRAVNYGWRRLEGRVCYAPSSGCSATGTSLPIITYRHLSGRCSVTGGYVYRGTAQPELARAYLYGDYCSGEIWAVDALSTDAQGTARRLLDTSLKISSFGEDEDGELYVVDLNGSVFHLTASAD